MKVALSLLGTIVILGLGAVLSTALLKELNHADAPVAEKGYILANGLTPLPAAKMPQIPTYPDAKLLEDMHSDRPPGYARDRTWEINTTDSEMMAYDATHRDVQSFYSDMLPKYGWRRLPYPTPNPWTKASNLQRGGTPPPTPIVPNRNDDPYYPLVYYWLDNRDFAPYNYKVVVCMDHWDNSVKPHIYVTIFRVPNVNKIPIPPNAEQIEVHDSEDGNARTITFITDLKSYEMVGYYRNGLRRDYGWDTGESNGSPHFIWFSYSEETMDQMGPGMSGGVFITLDTSGKTNVRIEVGGLKAFADLQRTP